jgi:type IV pilus assembly protein PilO
VAGTTDKLLTLPTGSKVAIVIALMIGLGGFWYLTFYADTIDDIKSQTLRSIQLAQQYEDEKVQEKNLKELETVIEALRVQSNRMRSALPESLDLDDFLQNVENAALAAGLKLVEFVPAGQSQEALYVRIPVKLKLIGRYSELVSFFDSLRSLDRIVNVENIELTALERHQARQLVEASCVATTFMYKPVSKQSAAKGGKK